MFELFVTDDVVDFIVDETNCFVNQVLKSQTMTRRSRLKAWSQTNGYEMKRFLGMVTYIGVTQLPEISLCWTRKQLYCCTIIPWTMDRDLFQIIMGML